MATFREMQDAVIAACQLGESERTVAKSALNEAYYAAVADARLNHLTVTKTIVAGTYNYSIASAFLITDLVDVRSVMFTLAGTTDAVLAKGVDPTFIERLRQTSNQGQGNTYLWALAGDDTFMIWPATAGTIAIRYGARPAAMSLDADTPTIIPAEHHDVIVLGACLRAGRREDRRMAQEFRLEHKDAMRNLHRWKSNRQGSLPKRIRVRTRDRLRGAEDIYFPGDTADREF